MPELPEVETVALTLRPQLAGRLVTAVSVQHPDVVAGLSVQAFERALLGARFEGVSRRGKYLLLRLRGAGGRPARLVFHLRMTGRLFCVPASDGEEKHTHLRFTLDDGRELRFVDSRRFGRAYLLSPEAGAGGGTADGLRRSGHETRSSREEPCLCREESCPCREESPAYARPPKGLVELGPEPLAARFPSERWARMLSARRRQIKALLLDQSFIAGLGNIYTDEALFRARISPRRRACDLTPSEARRLLRSVRRVLREAIGEGGTTIRDYVDGRGREGEFAARLRVYGREGQPCPVCGTPIERYIVAGRSTYICPRCQGE